MKITTLLLFITFFGGKAQQKEPKMSYFVHSDPNPKSYISVGYKSTNIEIEGDTIQAIKHLVAFIKQLQDDNEEQYICIDRSVQWHNKVSDYFKTGKEYRNYQNSLRKRGYKVKIKK